ncbi:Scr1 family TA system antitoxin-like transcriptional regulator [Streptomyces sp. DH37]|uniref:Scr1 family TA system antitoxin-like transcriptional regulator n=1 Tax=Streptomyces sp. DH37 TaxID=3040122 RepID=UPI00244304E1|nr:Scr1 family TA system antitoxin-like transcriptional regulator [Streptomyces sp. DH37]MDG9702970.1 Scr1 family TA system antitoxin-like transcriptional regulator [Streptomyces sp. DH37]
MRGGGLARPGRPRRAPPHRGHAQRDAVAAGRTGPGGVLTPGRDRRLTVAWVETGHNGELVEEAAKVNRLQVDYDRLRDQALSARDSAEFLLRLLEGIP